MLASLHFSYTGEKADIKFVNPEPSKNSNHLKPKPFPFVGVVNSNSPMYPESVKPESMMFVSTQKVFSDQICQCIEKAEENMNEKDFYEYNATYQTSNISNDSSALPNINVRGTLNYYQYSAGLDNLDHIYENSSDSSIYFNSSDQTKCAYQESADILSTRNLKDIPTNDYAFNPMSLINPNEITHTNLYEKFDDMFEEMSAVSPAQVEDQITIDDFKFDPFALIDPKLITYSNSYEKLDDIFEEFSTVLSAQIEDKITTNHLGIDPFVSVDPKEITFSNSYKNADNMFEELSAQIEDKIPTNDYTFNPLINLNAITHSNSYEKFDDIFEELSALLPSQTIDEIETNDFEFDLLALVDPKEITNSNSYENTDNMFEELSTMLPSQTIDEIETNDFEFDLLALVDPKEITYSNSYKNTDNMFEEISAVFPTRMEVNIPTSDFEFDPFLLVDQKAATNYNLSETTNYTAEEKFSALSNENGIPINDFEFDHFALSDPFTLYEYHKNILDTSLDLWTLDENQEYLRPSEFNTYHTTNKVENLISSDNKSVEKMRNKIEENIVASEKNITEPAGHSRNEKTDCIDKNVATSNSIINTVVNCRYNTRSMTRSTSLPYKNVDKSILISKPSSDNPVNILCNVSSTTSSRRNSMKTDNCISRNIKATNFIAKSPVDLFDNNNNLITSNDRNLDKITYDNDENIMPSK
ncbi:uncharacterized protein LOC106655202 [Trichogramma pretiosum]|uniref:uncharacterized protein LOC106655202 n=1 Tax=Trichogramma pretiosum TaxID=7493 RepID=UPI0006C9560F|nr:uncharacterized protein LOC106655202 [Trichogramma pretiosum]